MPFLFMRQIMYNPERKSVFMTFDKVRELICEQLDLTEDRVTPETTMADLGADSLDLVDLAMSLEEEFDIEIPDDDIEHIKSVSDLVNLLDKLTA